MADQFSLSDIYVQRLDARGVSQWLPRGAIVSSATGLQINPRIVKDGDGGAIITWQDYRNGTDADIYAQRVFANGTLKATRLFFPIKSKNGKVSIIYLD